MPRSHGLHAGGGADDRPWLGGRPEGRSTGARIAGRWQAGDSPVTAAPPSTVGGRLWFDIHRASQGSRAAPARSIGCTRGSRTSMAHRSTAGRLLPLLWPGGRHGTHAAFFAVLMCLVLAACQGPEG